MVDRCVTGSRPNHQCEGLTNRMKHSKNNTQPRIRTSRRLDRKLKTGARSLYRLPSKLTYAAVVDALQNEKEITEFMTRRACDEVEQYQQFPFGPVPGGA